MRLLAHITLGLGLALSQAVFNPPQYPDWPHTPVPKVVEPPKAEVVDSLPAGRVYVVLHNGDPCQLLVSPPDAASVRQYKDQVTIVGVFADGAGQEEDREYKAKQIFRVKRLLPGKFELIKVPAGTVERRLISDGVAPAPDPKPKPDDPPPVVVDPSPWNNAPGLRVLFVYPSNVNLSPGQDSIIYGKRVRDYLDSHAVKSGNDSQYRIWPSNADVSSVSPEWKKAFDEAFSQAKQANSDPIKTTALFRGPWVVIGSGAKWESVPLPSNPDEALKLLAKYGG